MTGTWYGSGNQTAVVHADSVIIGHTKRLGLGTNISYRVSHHDCVLLSAEYATALGDTFTVTLPRIVLNGRPWDLPRIRFTRVRKWVLMPLNC